MSARKLVILGLVVCLAACSKTKGLDEMQAVEQKWIDGVRLASSTARIALAPQVATLQSIKRELQPVEVSDCLSIAKNSLEKSMDLTIESFMLFMSQSEYLSDAKSQEAADALTKYTMAKANCN